MNILECPKCHRRFEDTIVTDTVDKDEEFGVFYTCLRCNRASSQSSWIERTDSNTPDHLITMLCELVMTDYADKPLDGDEVDKITEVFKKELNEINGNV